MAVLLSPWTETDNRTMPDVEEYLRARIETLQEAVRRLTLENERLRGINGND